MRVRIILGIIAIFSLAAYLTLTRGSEASAVFSLEKLSAENAGQASARSVAASDDTIMIGTFDDANNGVVHIYESADSETADKLRYTLSVHLEGDSFGESVAIADKIAVIGAPNDNEAGFSAGAVYVFERIEEGWIQRAKLTASDADPMDIFGHSVAIDAGTIVVGASGVDASSGAAYVFELSNGKWTEQSKITSAQGKALDFFGTSVTIDENTIVVGSIGDDASCSRNQNCNSGAAYVFERGEIGWIQHTKLTAQDDFEFGISTSIGRDTIVVGSRAVGSPSVHVFERQDNSWQESGGIGLLNSKLLMRSVATDGDTVVIGTESANGTSSLIQVFERDDDGWTQYNLDSGGIKLGGLVAIEDGTIVVGSPSRRDRDERERENESEPQEGEEEENSGAVFKRKRADLAITKIAEPDPVIAGEELIYTIEVENIGQSKARKVRVIDILPVDASFKSVETNNGECTHTGVTVRCGFDELAPEESATIRIVTIPTFEIGPRPPYPGEKTIENKVRVTFSGPDQNMENNSASVETLVTTP